MKFTFLGTGTSHGVPVIGCECKVCKSRNKKDKRFRCSAHILSQNGTSVIIDLSPEFLCPASAGAGTSDAANSYCATNAAGHQ